MAISPNRDPEPEVAAVSVDVSADTLRVTLSDLRSVEISFASTPWLRWLRDALPSQQANWSIEPGGFAVFWPDLDDGVEVRHLLSLAPIS